MGKYYDIFALTRRPVVFLDFETTGLRPSSDRVIEVAAIRWDEQGRHCFTKVVNPGVPVPPFITRKTGITQHMVDCAPPSATVFHEFRGAVIADNPLIVAHNVSFDLGFLNEELGRIGCQPFGGPAACTLRLSRKYVATHNRRHRLGDVAAALGVQLVNAHRALADAEACEQIFLALWTRLAGKEKWLA